MPVILIDWSDVREQLRMMTLRASVSVQGRSVTLYERTFKFADYNAPRSHNAFLAELAQVLPSHVTDWIHANPVKTDESKLCSYSLALGSLRASR